MRTTPRFQQRAAALVVVLSVVLVMVLIVVALTQAMRLERQAAHYYGERIRADLMAREAVESAKAILSDALDPTNGYAVSQPGRIRVKHSNGSWTSIELASGPAASTGTGVLAAAELNRTVKSGDGMPLIDPEGGSMNLSWVYVYRNGERTTNATPPISAANPIIGRYAYWVDDESTRINVNTAWKRQGNTNSRAHPSQIELQGISAAVTEAQADAIFTDRKSLPLESAAQAGLLVPGLQDVFSTNRFALTAYNPVVQRNPFGEPKIFLTTQKNNLPSQLAGATNASDYFLDILSTDNTDPGTTTAINYDKLSTQIVRLQNYLKRTDWPYLPGKSFAGKFSPGAPDRAAQLAINIIEYVRAAESTNSVVYPMRVKWNGSKFVATSGNPSLEDYMGGSRGPRVTELAVRLSDTLNTNGYYMIQVRSELFLPEDYGLNSISLIKAWTLLQVEGGVSASTDPSARINSSGGPTTPSSNLMKGDYAVITSPAREFIELGRNKARPATVPTRLAVYYEDAAGTPRIFDLVPNAYANKIVCPVNPLGDTNWHSVEVSDPRVNRHQGDWIPRPSGNTFGAANSIWLQQNGSGTPLTDGTDADRSLHMPPPKGATGNPSGMLNSVADLGFVTTGAESSTNGVPWRTVRLRPTSANDAELPDWALLDLFTAPLKFSSAGEAAVYQPLSNTLNGKINLNAAVQPFSDAAFLVKAQPIRALTLHATNLPTDVETKIRNHILATNGRASWDTNYYVSAGQLAEIEGVADAGEASEERFRQLYDLSVVRGDVFRVFAIGQALQQTPSGELRINSSKTVETAVGPSGSGTPLYRSLWWREVPF